MNLDKEFEPGDRIIYEGEYIGILLERTGSDENPHWRIDWEDGAETPNVYPQAALRFANGGRSSARRGSIQAVFAPENLAKAVTATGLSLQTVTAVARALRGIA